MRLSSQMARIACLLIVQCAFVAALHGQPPTLPPVLQNGTTWLTGQVQANGSLANENVSIALPVQSRAESAGILATLSNAPNALLTLVAGNADLNTEAIARRIIATARSGVDTSNDVSTLLSQQSPDGGWGLTRNFQSDPLDTALALHALRLANASASAQVKDALSYLSRAKLADGGWGPSFNSSVDITSRVLIAASDWSADYSVADISSASTVWLLGQRDISLKYPTVVEDAIALRALATQAPISTLQVLVDTLNGAQLANGSWSDDPYITAVVLDALWFVAQPNTAPTTGDVKGTVTNASTGQPIGGATVQLVEIPSASVSTAADGTYTIAGIEPGTYTVRASATGFQTKVTTIQISAGSVLNLGSVALAPMALSASISGVARDNVGHVLEHVIVAVGTSSTQTDATGAYLLTGLGLGDATITAELPGYQTVVAPVSLSAGGHYTFSPTLYPNATTPPSPSLQGIVVDAVTAQAIVNASVVLGGSTQNTDANGKFFFANVSAGKFSLAISASGYQGATLTGVLVSGSNDVGSIALSVQAQTSTVGGKVTDADTHVPVAGAVVAVQGQSITANSGADGSYTLAGIMGTNLVLNVDATGYLQQAVAVTLPQVGNATVNIELTKPLSSGVSFDAVQMNKPVFSPHDLAILDVQIRNATASAASLVVSATVDDAQGNVIFQLKGNASGRGQDPPNLPLIFAANTARHVSMPQAMLRQAAGTYTVHARASDTQGRVVASGDTQFSVASEGVLEGALLPDPPLTQLDSNLPVKLSADLSNNGNLPIEAGSLDLKILLQAPDTQTILNVSAQPLVSGIPLDHVRGLVRDSAGNTYSLNQGDRRVVKVDPSGNASIVATMPVDGPGLAIDGAGNLWVPSFQNVVYKVSPQGGISQISIASLYAIAGIEVTPANDMLLTGVSFDGGEQRLVRRDAAGIETVLWRNGLDNPESLVKDDAGNYVITNYGDNSLSKVSSSTGQITPFLAGLNRPLGITRDLTGNLYVANNGDNTIVKVTPAGVASVYATGLMQPRDVKFDAAGNLYVSNEGDSSIAKVLPNGSVSTFAQGIAHNPMGMKYDAIGNLWIANQDGTIRKKDVQNHVTVVATGIMGASGLETDGNDVYVANSYGTLNKISGTTVSTLASTLSSPYGVALANDQHLYVTEQNAARISIFDKAGNSAGVVQSLLRQPGALRVASNDVTYVQNSDSITTIDHGAAHLLVTNFFASDIAVDPVAGGILATSSSDVYRIAANGTMTRLTTSALPFFPQGVAVSANGDVLVLDYQNKRVQKLDGAGHLSIYANLPDYCSRLASDAIGNVYVRENSGPFFRVGTDASVTLVATASNQYQTFGFAGNGQILLRGYFNDVYLLDPATGVITSLIADAGTVSGLAGDSAGHLLVADSAKQEVRSFAQNGTLLTTLSGFVNPTDIVWTGADLRFIANGDNFFSLIPGGYPQKLGEFASSYLTAHNGEVYGLHFDSIVHWNGSASESWLDGISTGAPNGIAARSDGALSVSDNALHRVLTFKANKTLESDLGGMVQPSGLAFDAQGRLYVGNRGNFDIERIDPSGGAPEHFADVAYPNTPHYLAFDSAGNLLVSGSDSVNRFDSAGNLTLISNKRPISGLLVDGNALLGIDSAASVLVRLNVDDWDTVAAGLTAPEAVHQLANGDILIANHANATIAKYAGGSLTTFASNLPGVHDFTLGADSALYAVGDAGFGMQISADGVRTDLRLSSALQQEGIYGIVPTDNPRAFRAIVSGYSRSGHYDDVLDVITLSQAGPPPAAGTIVYQASVPMGQLAVSSDRLHVDLGSWLPPFGGDFRVDVSRQGIVGGASNFIHVGPLVNGSLSALNPLLTPGDQTESMCLSVSGADFTSVARVEVGEVKKVYSVQPSPAGMVADRSGNLFYSTYTTLYRVSPQGQTQVVGDSLQLYWGIGIDSQQNVYVPQHDPTTGHVIVLKFDPLFTQSVFVDLNVPQAMGLTVDNHDNILVGVPGEILKVDPQGHVSVLSMQGAPQPMGISVDSKDNVYVQNQGSYLSEIRPDGSVIEIFSRGDGVVDPKMEDENPSVAPDCASNLFLAPFRWDKLGAGIQQTEEHTLAEIVPKTGQVSLVFDTLTIDPSLQDVDYFVFDRFASRLLYYNDYTYQVWQVPVTCGAIGAQAHLMTAPGQSLTGISVPQSATVPQADGRTDYVWSLKDVSASGQQICFDTTLKGLVLGEARRTLDSGYLSFQNSFAPNEIQVALEVPLAHVGNAVQITAVTDQAEYSANATAQVTTTLTNQSSSPVSGTLTVDIVDANGTHVGTVNTQNVTIAASTTLPVTGSFSIGTILPAQYKVVALLNSSSVALATATSTFTVLPHSLSASALSTVHTDRTVYNPTDNVQIGSRVVNQSVNVVLSNLSLMVQVNDANGNVEFAHGYSIAQLRPQAIVDLSSVQQLVNLPAGTYTVKQDLLDVQQHVLSHAQTTYSIGSSSDTGAGIVGTIGVTQKVVHPGDMVQIAANAISHGNAPLPNASFAITVIDPVTQTLVQRWTQFSTLSPEQTVALTQLSLPAPDRVGTTYVVSLTFDVGNGPVLLASDTFLVSATPATGLSAVGGTPQSTLVNQPYPATLQVSLLDTNSQPVVGAAVNFASPAAGASVSFLASATVTTDQNGRASVAALANGTAGTFTVSATSSVTSSVANFELTNLAPASLSIAATGGATQSAPTGSGFGQELQATLTDGAGHPVPNTSVTFSGPVTGPSAAFTEGQVALTDSDGVARVHVSANMIGGAYEIVATAAGVPAPAKFSLTNIGSRQVDLRTLFSARSTALAPGQTQYYHVHIDNLGPDTPVTNALTVLMPPEINWLQAGSGASTCVVSGAQVTCPLQPLPAGTGADLCFAARVRKVGPMTAIASAQTSADAGSADPNTTNNAMNVSTQIIPDLLYADGFEPCWFQTDVIFIDGFE